jgi:hypothetical protein
VEARAGTASRDPVTASGPDPRRLDGIRRNRRRAPVDGVRDRPSSASAAGRHGAARADRTPGRPPRAGPATARTHSTKPQAASRARRSSSSIGRIQSSWPGFRRASWQASWPASRQESRPASRQESRPASRRASSARPGAGGARRTGEARSAVRRGPGRGGSHARTPRPAPEPPECRLGVVMESLRVGPDINGPTIDAPDSMRRNRCDKHQWAKHQ